MVRCPSCFRVLQKGIHYLCNALPGEWDLADLSRKQTLSKPPRYDTGLPIQFLSWLPQKLKTFFSPAMAGLAIHSGLNLNVVLSVSRGHWGWQRQRKWGGTATLFLVVPFYIFTFLYHFFKYSEVITNFTSFLNQSHWDTSLLLPLFYLGPRKCQDSFKKYSLNP